MVGASRTIGDRLSVGVRTGASPSHSGLSASIDVTRLSEWNRMLMRTAPHLSESAHGLNGDEKLVSAVSLMCLFAPVRSPSTSMAHHQIW